jgi:hypothetical protein
MTHPAVDERAVIASLAALRMTLDDIRDEIRAIPDSQRAFAFATELGDLLREAADEAATLRAQMVGRIWDEEKLSLAALAERISMSRSRAAQLMKAARSAKEGTDHE